MAEALRAAGLPALPGERHVPPVSTFPLTRAAREALRITREKQERRLELGEPQAEVLPWRR